VSWLSCRRRSIIYAYLLSLAFETDQFYAPERLRPMPEERIQQRSSTQFQVWVLVLLHRDASFAQTQAEAQVWQQIEAALLAESIDLSQERRPEHADAD
jgi:hypothetical protein